MSHPSVPLPDQAPDQAQRWDDGQSEALALARAASGVVIGSPGSGKTAVLIERVRRAIAAGTPADGIVVLTPSRQTATDLRDRLALTVEAATTGALARSVPSFAYQIVRAADVAGGAPPPQLLTGADEDQIVADLLEGDAIDEAEGAARWPAWLPPVIRSTAGFRAELRAFLAECTTLGVTPRSLASLAESADLDVWSSIARFQADYLAVRAAMRGTHRDTAGLVREAAGLFGRHRATRGDVSLGPFSALTTVLVDDAQELTLGGVELLESCHAAGLSVVAFGDPDIGSGAFRGATPENFARLTRSLGGVRATLRGAHRGTPGQTDIVRAITSRIGAGGEVSHRQPPAGTPQDDTTRAFLARSPAEELDVIARVLRERHVQEGVAWAECAVIAHDTRQVSLIESELAARDVPTRGAGQGEPLGATAPVRDLVALIALADTPWDAWEPGDVDAALRGLCGGLDAIAVRRLRSALRVAELEGARSADEGETGRSRPASELLREALAHPLDLDAVGSAEARRAQRLGHTLAALREGLERGDTAHELLWTAWERSGREKEWAQAARGHGPLAEQAGRDLDAVVALFQAAKRFGEREPNGDPRVFLRGVRDADVADDRLGAPERAAAVAVMTPAAAAGREFDTVVVAGVQEGVWPNTRLRGGLLETWRLGEHARGADAPDVLDRRRAAMHDELRLLARACSRARRALIVTAVDDDDMGPSVFFELLPAAEPVPAHMAHPLSLRGEVARHRRALTDPAASDSARAAAPGQLALLARSGVAGAHPEEWYGIRPTSSDAPLRDPARESVPISPSRLTSLERCALDWVVADLGGDTGGPVAAGIGTILHAALEDAVDASEAALWAIVEQRWGELTFESAWRERAERARARDLVRRLHLYLTRFAADGGRLVEAEPRFDLAVPYGDPTSPGIVVSGYIDRVEVDSAGRAVIVDLKTGKSEPQSDRAVADNPQLAAYQLAFASGAIPAVEGREPGGAKLLVLRPTAAGRDYVEPRQAPYDANAQEAFRERLRAAADVMTGRVFEAPYEEHCRDDFSYGLCRIHTVKAVSAS